MAPYSNRGRPKSLENIPPLSSEIEDQTAPIKYVCKVYQVKLTRTSIHFTRLIIKAGLSVNQPGFNRSDSWTSKVFTALYNYNADYPFCYYKQASMP